MKHLKTFEAKRETEVDRKIAFLWDFFIDIKDDGLNVTIQKDSTYWNNSKNYKYITVSISDPYNLYKDVEYSHPTYFSEPQIIDKKPIREILDRLKSIGIVPRKLSGNRYSGYNISFDRYSNKKYGIPI